jgi:hypothetical protein
MQFGRRQFLGAIAASAASVICERGAAQAVPLQTASPWGFMPACNGPAAAVEVAPGTPALLPRALAALEAHRGHEIVRDTIGIVDFAAPSRDPRFYLIDVASRSVSDTFLVAHGKGSDPANRGWVERLSNRNGSEASCSGSFLTGALYSGEHGPSRRLIGLDPENDQAIPRGIVIHAASYVSKDMAAQHGRVGRSQGCFAVSPGAISKVLALLGPGRLLYAAR